MTKECLMDAILQPINLQNAQDAVRRNKGCAGIDGKSIVETEQHWQQHGPEIEAKLRAGSYVPTPLMGMKIPKANSGERLLGIPTVQDRIIQQAVQQILSDKFDRGFSPHSYGYRAGHSAHQAVLMAQSYVRDGKSWVIDIDISAFFDEVNHDILLHQVSRKIEDKSVLDLIRRYLKTGIMIDGRVERRDKGTPQGSPLSPLLANIYLDQLDKELEKRELSFCRYADDISIYVGSERSAQRVLESLTAWIAKHLKLSVNQDKSGTGRPWERQFLSFQITEEGKIAIAPKAIESYKMKVRSLWNARQSLTSKQLVRQWQTYSMGWWNYFKLAGNRQNIERIAGWTRRHMRKCFWLRWHNKKGRLNALRRLGAKPRQLKLASSSLGAWPIAKCPILHMLLSKATLRRYGLYAPSELSTA
ncbi:MAG: group II intron reverse transcriptase/maturase [Methylococcaceae bacterium]